MPASASFLSQSSHCSLYLCNWYICHLDGHMKSHKFWCNFPTTRHSSSHYTTQWILMVLIFPWKQNQILKPALPSLSLPCHAYFHTYSILHSLASSLPSAHHIHSLISLLLFPYFSTKMSYSLSLLWIQTLPSISDNIYYTSIIKLSPRLQPRINPLLLF